MNRRFLEFSSTILLLLVGASVGGFFWYRHSVHERMRVALSRVDLDGVMWCIHRGESPNSGASAGVTPLMVACARGDLEATRELLMRGADPNARDPDRETVLCAAIASANPTLVRELIKAGADLQASDGRGNIAVYAAAGVPKVETLKVLAEAGADLHGGNEAALGWAAWIGNDNNVRWLIGQGARTDQIDQSGFTPLARAVFFDRLKAAQVLLEADADPNALGWNGVSPLYIAEQRCRKWPDDARCDLAQLIKRHGGRAICRRLNG